MPDESVAPPSPISSGLPQTLAAAYRAFGPRARRQLVGLLIVTIIGAALEALGAAVIVPFIALINDPTYLQTQPVMRAIYQRTGLSTTDAFITACALALFAFFVLKNLYLTLMSSVQFRFIYGEMPRFSSELFAKYMARPLHQHTDINSTVLVRNVSNEVLMYFTNFLIPALTLATELLVLIAVLSALLWIAPVPSLIAIVLLGGSTKLFSSAVRKRVREFGKQQQVHNAERIKWVNQGLGSIKETKILAREPYFVERFLAHEERFAKTTRYAMLLNQTPRLFIETIVFAALFLGVIFALRFGHDRSALLPVLALFAVAAVRLLPSLNRILLSITRMAYYRPAADVVLQAQRDLGDLPVRSKATCPRRSSKTWHELSLEGVRFAYAEGRDVFDEINLTIRRGTSVALIGPSGSGKTTLADLVLGLLQPSVGRILLDGLDIQQCMDDWQSRLGYVPQSTYLLDDSIRRNVALGLADEAIDDERVWNALRLAKLDGHVRVMPGQLSASVGENGSRLSGGQRQRLGIARALYEEPELLVLDEATSALDGATESAIADTLEGLVGERTLLVIAHRPETINRCQFKFAVAQHELVQ